MEVTLPVARRAWSVPAVVGWASFALVLALVVYTVVGAPLDGQPTDPYAWSAAATGLFGAAMAAMLLTRLPRHPIGWLFLVLGITRAVAGAAGVWSVAALVTHPGRPVGALASWLQLWTPSVGLALAPLVVILFPDGRLPGPRWRVVPVLSGLAVVLVAVVLPAGSWSYRGPRLLAAAPVPDDPFAHIVNALYESGIVLAAVSAVIALVGLLVRARRSTGDVRQQIKWFGFGTVCAFLCNVLAFATGIGWLILIGIAATFLGVGFGIFRFRLYDVDRLIRRTLIYGLVTVALVTAFAALDVTGAVVTGRDSTVAVALAAFVVALLLRPARDRAQDLVDRLYDHRAYNGIRLMRRLGQRVGREVVDPVRVRDALRLVLRDPGLDVFYSIPQAPDEVMVDGAGDPVDLSAAAGGRSIVAVQRDGRDVAVIVHGSVDELQLAALLPAAASVLEHARLQAELSVQLAALRASRGRIAAAGDAERRRIERDLHDGAQQRLVGLAVHIQSARRGTSHPPDVDELLTFTVEQLQAGVADIRALVHGILPPALVSAGLPAALAELGDVAVLCDLTGRLHPDIEATAWFVACEGVANAHKHAPGAAVTVTVGIRGAWLHMEVGDRGPGGARPDGDGLRSLADRVDAHGGALAVHSPAGGGTRLTADLPCG
jgi:signal transduction histidine kinase